MSIILLKSGYIIYGEITAMELVNRLQSRYDFNTPIFTDEIFEVMNDYSRPRIYQLIAEAVENKLLLRFDNGVYYLPTRTVLGYSKLNPQKVVEKRYISFGNDVYGIYSGVQLLNAMGLSDQVPATVEVLTNNESMRYREVTVGYLKVILRKARIPISANNVNIFTLWELFNMLNPKIMKKGIDYGKVIAFINERNISAKEILSYTNFFPARAAKNLINSGVLHEIV